MEKLKFWKIVAAVAVILAVVAICITIAVAVVYTAGSQTKVARDDTAPEVADAGTSDSIIWPPVPPSNESQYRFAGAATSQPECAAIGTKMLTEGGSAVDAAISISLCLGVYKTISSGIGGGGYMTVYEKSTGNTVVLDFRERAPLATNATFYADTDFVSDIGPGSIAVPGEIPGLWQAHQRFGKLPWSRLFEPSIQIADDGIVINAYLEYQLGRNNNYENMNDQLKAIFTNSETGEAKKEGDIAKFPKLAETYRRIANDGIKVYYNGTLRDDILADLNDIGSVITEEDWTGYQVDFREPVRSVLSTGDFTVLSPPPPSGGLVVQYILNILDGYGFTADSVSARKEHTARTATTYHRMVESMKFAYAKRSNLGDINFVNVNEYIKNMTNPEFCNAIRDRIEDSTTHDTLYYGLEVDPRETTGTSQLAVIAGNGDAVAMTTTINYAWGSKMMGARTGIIFNNEMDDFAKPDNPSWTDDAWTAPSNENNWIEPGKRPLSSVSPSVILDKEGNVRLVTGGSGGSKIISATATTIINNLWFNMSLVESVSRPRLHHQLLPTSLHYEEGFPEEYLNELRGKGHDLTLNTFPPVTDSCSADGNNVYAFGDLRRLGGQDGF